MKHIIQFVKQLFPNTHPIRLLFHKVKGVTAAVLYGFPARKLKVIGVTGTDGKSTTTSIIAQLLTLSGKKVGMASTVMFQIGDRVWTNTTHKTTLSPFGLQKLLRQMVDAGCTHAVIETSSHALIQSRVWGIPYSTGVFTNLAREHLDYHHTMDEYFLAKKKLFEKVSQLKSGKRVFVLNGNDTYSQKLISLSTDVCYVFGRETLPEFSQEVQKVVAKNIQITDMGQAFDLQLPSGQVRRCETTLIGLFNIDNILAALITAHEEGIPFEKLCDLLPKVHSVPGRMEKVIAGQDFQVIIDYAVTPQALEKCYRTLRAQTKGQLVALLGACGDRDKGKRKEMGFLATSLCDSVIFTNEESYTEDPKTILSMLVSGAEEEGRGNYKIIEERRDALRYAIRNAHPGDVLVITGMGDQTSMVIGNTMVPWSDREVAREEIISYLAHK